MEEIKKWNSNSLDLFTALLSTTEADEVQRRIDEVKSMLQNITTMIHALTKQSGSEEDLGEIIERELSDMDKAIEEAAARIEVTKIFNDGIKLFIYRFILSLGNVGHAVEIKSIRFGY